MLDGYTSTYFARRLTRWLVAVAAALLVLHLLVMWVYWEDVIPSLAWEEVSIFDLDTEESIGTWFSAVLLLMAGRFLWLQRGALRRHGERDVLGWTVLAVGFHILSLDEVAGMHEYLNQMLKSNDTGIRWTAIGGPAAALVGLAYVPWLLRLPARTRAFFIVGGVLYLGGAVLVERATDVYEDWGKLNTYEYHLWIALEEGLEMVGVIVFLRGLLGHMAGGSRAATVDVGTRISV